MPRPFRRKLPAELTTYQQHGNIPPQHAAPATQQTPANAVAENADAAMAAVTLM